MKLIVGLGNPGRQYEGTRHNVGFRTVDELARRWQIDVGRRRFSGQTGAGAVRGQRVLLLKPLTYMNLSGRSVREAMVFHKLEPEDLVAIVDDLALPLCRLRIRRRGSAGGHNGLASIIGEIGSDGFARLRIGIGYADGAHAVNHVLGRFSAEEETAIAETIGRAADAIEHCLAEGVDATMNLYNCPDGQAGD